MNIPVRRTAALAAILAIASTLGGCVTHRVKVPPSAAVLDARAHLEDKAQLTCAEIPLSTISPATVGFDFREAGLSETAVQTLNRVSDWLACHAGASVVVVASADKHGSPEDQRKLADTRAAVVLKYLLGRGVGMARLHVLAFGAAEPADPSLVVIHAEGQRW